MIELKLKRKGGIQMKVIVCCENSNGVLFNNRRVSQDRVVSERIIELTKSSKLWMDNYSYSLFKELNAPNINLTENILSEAADSEYCFVEKQALVPYEKWISEIFVFRWDRDYPFDKEIDVDLSDWKLKCSEEFRGNSHEKITMEVYER